MNERVIDFERCHNFRDLGGYETSDGRRVRRRRLFRSMTPEYMSDTDVQRARDELGIRAVLDLRRIDNGVGSGALGEPPSVRAVVPFADARVFAELRTLPHDRVLVRGLELNAANIVASLEFLTSRSEGATLFHCTTGKDRTGTLAAVTLKLLGVGDEDVVEDFAYSAAAVAVMLRTGIPVIPADAPAYASAPPEESWIRGVLKAIEEHGGAVTYLKAAGASDELIGRARASFLD